MNQTEYEQISSIINEVEKAVTGKRVCVMKVFATILAGGHILLTDVPGVGKTTMAVAFSKALSLSTRRVQFTPDVMPSDILGFSMYDKNKGSFIYYPGSIMCNLFLADEINRTSPKTQSALLEVMEEGRVTVDGNSYGVPDPFIVIATQNPKGSAGTQLLPESQLDRFMVCMSMGYPSMESEMMILKNKAAFSRDEEVNAVIDGAMLNRMKQSVAQVFIHDSINEYMVKLMQETRDNEMIELGVSPRGTIALSRLARAWAYLRGRDYVLPSDITELFMDVAKHRIVLSTKARVGRVTEEDVLKDILKSIKAPSVAGGKKRKAN
ncbi:MAG TPA: AAA family ATPase [Lachnospiraceae bacterium]|nr:AAA family ATPase [Lachnospiraceae bacterium]